MILTSRGPELRERGLNAESAEKCREVQRSQSYCPVAIFFSLYIMKLRERMIISFKGILKVSKVKETVFGLNNKFL